VNVVKEAAVVGVADAARGLWLWCAAVGGVHVLWCGRGSGLVVWWEMAKCANDEMEERVELPKTEHNNNNNNNNKEGEWASGQLAIFQREAGEGRGPQRRNDVKGKGAAMEMRCIAFFPFLVDNTPKETNRKTSGNLPPLCVCRLCLSAHSISFSNSTCIQRSQPCFSRTCLLKSCFSPPAPLCAPLCGCGVRPLFGVWWP
jgi:hypothetical protein